MWIIIELGTECVLILLLFFFKYHKNEALQKVFEMPVGHCYDAILILFLRFLYLGMLI